MTEDTILWEPVSSPDDFNDFPLAFANVDDETGELSFNVDGEEVEPDTESKGPVIQGTFKGVKDISKESNDPSIKVLVESEKDERTYAINHVTALKKQLEDEVEHGDVIGIDFEGMVEPEDGYPWQNWKVYTPAQ